MEAEVDDESLDLIVTSPPYALLQKKQYGNEDEENYVEWFLPFAQVFKRKLKPTGSLILNLGGAWMPGSPQRSLYIYRLLLRLCDKDVGYHFCQELYWYNPAKLPAPVQWVNKKRSRVKDAVEQIFWLSPTPEPKADNRDVLVEYSKSMERLIKTGKYNWGQRPSGHLVGKNWARDNGGAISSNLITDTDTRGLLDAILDEVRMPSNLLVESNTSSQGEFFERCRAEGIPVHPARFPPIIPEYFIRFLTDPGDLVCDPFAGSNTTGAVAEDLERRWISIELMPEYFEASAFRFPTVEWTRRDEP
jgi:site-specific DNA-methyltransferase (cytosine-N4-specific)